MAWFAGGGARIRGFFADTTFNLGTNVVCYRNRKWQNGHEMAMATDGKLNIGGTGDSGDSHHKDPLSIRLVAEFRDRGLIGDKYTGMKEIARGGMGIIYEVVDVGLERSNVLKIINPDMASNTELLKRFVEEARITGQLEHPNIVPVHDIGVLGGNEIYFSMKQIKGRELREIMDDVASSPPDRAPYTQFALLTIFRKVCDAVAFAHSKGIIHRDIKPDNILVGDFGEVLLVDWGLARRLDETEEPTSASQDDFLNAGSSGSVTRTRYGVIKGTPAYLAPEMASGDVDNVDVRSDIFLLGATLYALVTLEAPYTDSTSDDIYEILQRAETCQFAIPSERAPDRQIPPELERIVLKAMAFQPEHRYQTVQELSDDIDALLEGRAEYEQYEYKAGECLMREGERGEHAFVIVSGKADVFKTINDTQTLLVKLGPGSVVGEMALIDRAPRSASVIANTDTVVSIISQQTFQDTTDKMPPWFGRTVSSLAARLRRSSSELHPLLKTDCVYHVLNSVRTLYPFVGQPAEHPETGAPIIVLRIADVILETTVMLSLPDDHVMDAFGRILQTNLIVPVGEEHVYLPNYNLYTSFLNFVRDRLNYDSAIAPDRFADFFDADGVLTMAFSDAELMVTGDNAYAMTDPYELLGCSEDEVEGMFEQLFVTLMTPLKEAR